MTSVPLGHLVAAVALLLLVAALGLAIRRWYVRLCLRRKWSHARVVERQAARLLEEHGYVVLGSQVETSYTLLVDGEATEIKLRADYLVSRAGRQFVAEVKSGTVAPRLDTAATRRQLLEYRVAFQVDGVLLVDGESRRVHEVTFPMEQPLAREVSPVRFWLYVGMAVLVAVALWLLSRRL
jgi:hypothetical protein